MSPKTVYPSVSNNKGSGPASGTRSATKRMSDSATLTAIKKLSTDAGSIAVVDYTQNYDVARELGMDAAIAESIMKLLALTNPVEYQTLKQEDYAAIKRTVLEQFEDTFKKYYTTGMAHQKAKELSKRVCEQLHKGLMDIHDERFPSGASVVETKAFKKQTANTKLPGKV